MYSYQLVRVIDGSTVTLQVVYPGHEDGSEHLANGLKRITEEYNRRLTPSRLLFVCPCGVERTIAQVFNAQRSESEDRLVSITHITVAPFDENGQLASDDVVHLKSSKWGIHLTQVTPTSCVWGSERLGVPVGDDRAIRRRLHSDRLLNQPVEQLAPAT